MTSSAEAPSPSFSIALAQRLVGRAEDGGPHDRRDRRGPDVAQGVNGLAGLREPLAHRAGDVGDPGFGAEQAPGRAGAEPHAARRLARPDREGGSHPGQQGWVTEALPGLEHRDDRPLVDELDRAGVDHPQPGGGLAVLDQDHLPRPQLALLRAGGQLLQRRRVKPVKGRVASQECVQVLHVRRGNYVRILPWSAPRDVSA